MIIDAYLYIHRKKNQHLNDFTMDFLCQSPFLSHRFVILSHNFSNKRAKQCTCNRYEHVTLLSTELRLAIQLYCCLPNLIYWHYHCHFFFCTQIQCTIKLSHKTTLVYWNDIFLSESQTNLITNRCFFFSLSDQELKTGPQHNRMTTDFTIIKRAILTMISTCICIENAKRTM